MTDDEGNRPTEQTISPASISSAAAVGTLTFAMRAVLSPYHLQAAELFVRQSSELEDKHVGDPWVEIVDTVFPEHRAYVIGAIFAAVAFLEASINELFSDAVDVRQRSEERFGERITAKLAEKWDKDNFRCRKPILAKYQTALPLFEKARFDEKQQPYQDARHLIELRNELVHYKPQFIQAGLEGAGPMVHLRSKFAANRLLPERSQNPFFPDHCLSSGCAAWAVKASKALYDEFTTRMGLRNPQGTSGEM